jgi:hypothetical protein
MSKTGTRVASEHELPPPATTLDGPLWCGSYSISYSTVAAVIKEVLNLRRTEYLAIQGIPF